MNRRPATVLRDVVVIMHTIRLSVVSAAGVLLLSACGGAPSTTVSPPRVSVSVSPPGIPASVHDQGAATAVAGSLLRRAVLPPGSTSSPKPAAAALDQTPQSPATPDLADVARFAVAPGTPSQALAYLMAHRPAGSTSRLSGQGSAGSNGSATSEWVDDEITGMPAGVDSASLLVSVAPGPGGETAVRVDAQVTWLPAKPAGTTVPAADRVAVVSIVESMPQNPGLPAPRRVVVTNPTVVAALATAASALDAALPGTRSCPAALGTSYVVAFAATVDAPPDITYTNGSCGYVFVTSHGHQVATLASDLAFSHAYRHVLGLAG